MSQTAQPAAPPRPRPSWGGRLRGELSQLFPHAPHRSTTGRGVLLGLGIVLAGTAASLLRHPGTIALDTVWAEDGTIFLAGAADGSPIGAIASSYAGYFHLVPRLLGALASAVPVSAAPAVLAIASAAITAALALLVYQASAGHLTRPGARLLVAAPVLFFPLAQADVLNSIANLHWPALYATFWLLIWTPAGRVGRIIAPSVILLTALSDILILAFVPLAIVRLVMRRDRYSAALAGVLGAGLAVQFLGLLTGTSSRQISLSPVKPATGYLLRVAPEAIFGDRWLPDSTVDTRRLVLAALAWLVVGVALAMAARRITRPIVPLAAAAAVQSVALYALPVILTGIATPRYAVAPALLLVTMLVALLQPHAAGAGGPQADSRPARVTKLSRAIPLILAVGLVVCWALNFRVPTQREVGPLWDTEVDRARLACQTTGENEARIPITPADTGWTATLPCGYLNR